jgi:hypothetical protein
MISNFQNEFICGRKFQQIADFIRDTNRSIDYSAIANRSIIWCKTDFVGELFSNIKSFSHQYILITHNSDYSITKGLFESKPICIKKWFAQNVDYLHEDLIPLPIGLENDEGPSKGAYTDYYAIEKNINTANKFKDKVYCNFNVENYSLRLKTIEALAQNNIGFFDQRHHYASYCSNMSQYKFIASPRGNGIDCHRTWEALYMKCIPIVERHFMYNTYDLPILQVDRWEDVNKEWLESRCDLTGNYEQLKINYWLDKISKERDGL